MLAMYWQFNVDQLSLDLEFQEVALVQYKSYSYRFASLDFAKFGHMECLYKYTW